MSEIVSTDGVAVLCRYLSAMAVTLASTIGPHPGAGSENQQSAEIGIADGNPVLAAAGEKQERS